MKSNLQKVWTLLVCFAIGLSGWSQQLAISQQVLSPSTTPKAATAQGPGANQLEPSRQLLMTLDASIPFEVVGGETEAEVQEAARQFLAGKVNDSLATLTALREKHPSMPPPSMLISNMFYAASNPDLGNIWRERTVTEAPEHPEAYLGFARTAASQNRMTDCEALLEKAERLIKAGNWTEAQQKLFTSAYLDLQANAFIFRQKLEQAKSNLLKLKEMFPNNGQISVRLAQIEFDMKDIDKSIQYLNNAAQLGQKIRMPEVIVSDWYRQQGDYENSGSWMTRAAEKYSDNSAVLTDYARWLLQNDQLDESSSVVNTVEQLGGDPYFVGYLKGQIAFSKRDYAAAEAYFEELLKARPSDADTANMLALSLIASADPLKKSRALELASVNQRLYPKSPAALATLGWVQLKSGNKAAAENAFRTVMNSPNIAPVTAFYVANFLYEQGDLVGAKNLLQRALANKDYFFFRETATDLLKEIDAKLPSVDSSPEAESAPKDDK